MYEESKVRFNWKGFLLKLIIILLVLFLVLKLLPFGSKKESNGHTKAFNDNFSSIKEVGSNYFNKENLPKDNEESKITLRQLINSKKIKTLKGADKKVCNEDNSYIKSYKKNIGYELEVHLVCGEEEETSYIYLGCFDSCEVKTTTKTTTTTTTKTKTTKKSSDNSSKSSNSSSKTNKTTKKTTTTTTTRVKKYAVIFNENGGSKVSAQFIVEGKNASKPGNPTKNGYTFNGWYLNGKEYNFNTPVKENIILIAKWIPNNLVGVNITNTNKVETFNQTVYSVALANKNSSIVNTKTELKKPANLEGKNNVRIKSISYIRNILNNNDITNYFDSKNKTYKYDESFISNNVSISNFGLVDNVELIKSNNEFIVNWNASVKNTCNTSINNNCSYGIVYRVIWEYEA